MDWKVVFSARSKKDLQEIVEFIGGDGAGAALPQKPIARFFPFGAYLIIYRPDSERRVIRILRFWHAARRQRPSR